MSRVAVDGRAGIKSGDSAEPAPVIDAREFARMGQVREGVFGLAKLPRLRPMLTSGEGDVKYRLAGATDKHGRATLTLEFEARVRMTCQRCLGDFELPLTGSNRLKLVDAEPQWSPDSAEAAGHENDEIVASPELDVRSLVEDEVLLALPLAPRHDQCEMVGEKRAGDDIGNRRESPFDVLARLRPGKRFD